MIKKNDILRFKKFSNYYSLVHGFSTRFFSSMRPSHPNYQASLTNFATALNISSQKLVRMDQVHGNNIYFVSKKDCGTIIAKTDGIITNAKSIFLSVITADCIPLLFYDPKLQIVAAAHAGWRGLHNEIINNVVNEMIKKGGDPKDIIVGIGPSIRACCYEVSEEFIEKFQNVTPDSIGSPDEKTLDSPAQRGNDRFVIRKSGKIFFDLQLLAKNQLADLGILKGNIEDANYCTFDHKDLYSYRREGENFGEMMGIIGQL